MVVKFVEHYQVISDTRLFEFRIKTWWSETLYVYVWWWRWLSLWNV